MPITSDAINFYSLSNNPTGLNYEFKMSASKSGTTLFSNQLSAEVGLSLTKMEPVIVERTQTGCEIKIKWREPAGTDPNDISLYRIFVKGRDQLDKPLFTGINASSCSGSPRAADSDGYQWCIVAMSQLDDPPFEL